MGKAILNKKNQAGGISVPDSKAYYKVMAIKTAWHEHKNQYIHQWKRLKGSEINPYKYNQLYKSAKIKVE